MMKTLWMIVAILLTLGPTGPSGKTPRTPAPVEPPRAAPPTASPVEPPEKDAPPVDMRPDLSPELGLAGGGKIWPLQIKIANRGAQDSPLARLEIKTELMVGMKWHTYRKRRVDVPAIKAHSAHVVQGLSGPVELCPLKKVEFSGGHKYKVGRCRIKVRVDPRDFIDESAEDNNKAVATTVRRVRLRE